MHSSPGLFGVQNVWLIPGACRRHNIHWVANQKLTHGTGTIVAFLNFSGCKKSWHFMAGGGRGKVILAVSRARGHPAGILQFPPMSVARQRQTRIKTLKLEGGSAWLPGWIG